MKDPSDDIRDWIYTTIHNTVSTPVYSFPPEDVSYPYIVLGEQSGEGEDGAKDLWMWDVTTQIHVYTKHPGTDASYVPANTICSAIWQALRTATNGDNYATTEYAVPLANFNLIRVQVGAFSTERTLEETGIVISKQFSINILVEEN